MKIDENFVIDTNILIYYFDEKSIFYDFSREIIDENIDNIYIVHKSISEFICVLSKLNRYDLIEKEIQNIIEDFNILYPDERSSQIFKDLVLEHKPHGNKAYDYEIASVMIANNISKVITLNNEDFKKIKEIEIISKY
jgi:predicted nucleic acid-binding protein